MTSRRPVTGRPVLSVVVIPVAEARVLTEPWRGPRALEAHVTIAAPFLDPSVIDDHVVNSLHACLTGTRSFDVVFRRVAWFDQRVVYVAPDDPTPFEWLASTIAQCFNAQTPADSAQPYVAHLTIAKSRPTAELTRAAAMGATLLPLHTRATEAVLYLFDRASGSWRARARVPLDAPTLPDRNG